MDAAALHFDLKKITEILKQPPKSRSQREIDYIANFLSEIPFFQRKSKEVSSDFLYFCGKLMNFERFEPQKVIYSLNEQATKLFLVLSGTVKLEKEGNFLQFGDVFGDEIVNLNSKRDNSAVSTDFCELGVIYKTDFYDILSKIAEKTQIELIIFLHSLPAFARIGRGTLQKLINCLQTRELVWKQVLCKRGDPVNSVFIVKFGEFSLLQSISTPKTTVNLENLDTFRGGKGKKHRASVALVGPGEFIGDADVLGGRSVSQTCVCHSLTAEVLVVPAQVEARQEYLRFFEGEEMQNDLRGRLATKSRIRANQVRNIEYRLHSQTPTNASADRHTPPPVSRSKSYSKSSRNHAKAALLQSLKSRIMAHEPEVFPEVNAPRKSRQGGTVYTPEMEMSPSRFEEMGDITPVAVYQPNPGFRPNGVLHADLIRTGFERIGTTTANLLVKVHPTYPDPDSPHLYHNAWEARQRKEYFKRIVLNQKRLEVSKRNLWKNKQV